MFSSHRFSVSFLSFFYFHYKFSFVFCLSNSKNAHIADHYILMTTNPFLTITLLQLCGARLTLSKPVFLVLHSHACEHLRLGLRACAPFSLRKAPIFNWSLGIGNSMLSFGHVSFRRIKPFSMFPQLASSYSNADWTIPNTCPNVEMFSRYKILQQQESILCECRIHIRGVRNSSVRIIIRCNNGKLNWLVTL